MHDFPLPWIKETNIEPNYMSTLLYPVHSCRIVASYMPNLALSTTLNYPL